MNEKYQEFYDYLKSQNLTDLDAESFQIAYSEPEKFNELWGYISEQNLTDLTRDEFFDSYFSDVKKKDTASVSEPGSLVSPELEVPVETAIAPATEAAEPATTLTGAADPDFFEERMEMISPQLIDRGDEDEVAQELTDVFKPYGFEVEPAGIGDAIKVTAGNGKSIEVDLDPFEMPKILSPFGLDFNTETETAEAKKLQDFLRENRQEGLDAPRRFVTNKQRDDEVKRINQKQKEINRSAQDYLKRKLEFQNKYPQFLTYDPEYIKNNPEEYQRFLNDRDSLEKEREFLVEIDQKAKEEGAQLDRLAGEYTEMLAQRGYWSGGVFRNEFIQGIAEIAAGAKDFGLDTGYDPKFLMETDPEFFKDNYLKEAADKGYDVPSASDMTVDEFKAWMKTDKGIPAKESIAIQTSIVDTKLKRRKRGEPIDYEEALNAYSQYATSKNMEVTDGELAALRRGLDFLKDPESTPEAADLMYESFWGGALLGVTRSLPAILVPGGFITRTAAMYSQISSALEQEMAKDPDFRDISEAERFRLKLAIGSASSVLESLGVRNVLKQKGLLTGILMKALKKTPANVKGKAFNEVVMREINSAIGRGALVITGAGLAEFETGFLQEGVDIGFKSIYNEMKDKEMFETPEAGFWSSETFNRMLYAGAQEAVGGFVLGTPGAISAARGTYDFTAVDDATFEMFENVSSQTARGELTYRHMFYTNLQAKINQGKISKEDAQQEMDNLDEVIAVNRDIPSDLTVSQKKKALGILLRKKDLQEQIEGKDPILVKRQQEELNSLNGELDQILYGTPETDAIQEPSPETVDAPELTPSSEAVGEGVPDIGEPTTEVEAEDQVAEAPPTAEVAVEETVSEPTQEVTEEEQVDIDEFFGEQDIEGVEKVSENLVINRKQKAPTADPKSQRRMNRVRQMSVKAAASIRKIAPEVKILIHESPEEYQRFAGEQTAGNYDPKTKTIHINLGKANLYTAPHEVFHALLLQNISTDSEALTVSRKMLESVRKVVDPNSQMAKDIDEFVARYGDAPTIQDEEYLAQLTGILTAEYRTLNKPAKNAVKDFLRKLAKMLGLEKYLGPEFLKTDEQVIDLLNTISRRMSEGEYIEAADVQAMGDILSEATPAEQAQAQSEVEEFNRKQKEEKAVEDNLLNRSQEYVQDFDELERLNNEGVMFHFGPVDVQEVIPEKLKRMVSGYGIYFIDKAESPTTYSLYASRYGKRVTLVDGSDINLVDSDSKISKEEFTTLMNAFNKEVAALDEVSPEINELSEYLNELDLDLQGANPSWYEILTTMSTDLLPSDSDFFLGGVIDKPYSYTNPQKMFIAEVTAKALGYDGATTRVGKGSIEEHSSVNVWNFDKINKNIISDDAVTPRMQVVTEEDGKPVTFYHGTDKKFDKFEPQKSTRTILMSQYEVKTPAIFFTPDEAEAREYGDNVIPVNLQFEKLVEDHIDEAAKIITDYYVKEKDGIIEVQDGVVDLSDYYDEATDSYNNNWVKDVLDEAEGIDWMLLDEEALVEKFKEAGFDGTKVYEGDKAFSVATFYPENIVRLDQGMAPRQQVADAATSIQESLKFADKSSFPNKLEFKRALQERFDNEVYPLIKERYGVKDNRSNTDQGLKDYLVDAYLNETLTAIEAYPDALGWYDARITGAMSLMEKLHPELATDKDAASTFKIALAITSNGNKVYDNFVEANRQYEYFKENGKFDDTYSIGDQRAGILSTLAFTNKALESMSMADFTAFLTTKYRAGDLKYMKDGKKTPLLPGFAVDEEVYGASIFGPKIGNGFFMNLYGEFNQLTMDRWFMRQFGRLTGTLIDYDQKKVDAGTKRLNRATKALAKRNAAKLSEMIPGWDKMSAEELSSKIQKASMDLKKRAMFKSNPKLDEVRKAGNNLSKQVSAEVEAPRNSSQRKFINEVFTELQAKLKNDYDIDITIADLQAVNWYPEKALYQTFKADQSTKTGKVETSDNEQPDYESAAKKLVEEQGVSKKEIKEDEARRSKQLERNTANREAIEQRAGELNKDDIEASEVKRLKDKIISVKEDVTSSDLEEGVAPRQQVVYHVTVRDNKGNIQKKGLEKDRPPTFAKGVMGTEVFDTAGKSFAFSNLEDATKWGIKTKIEKDKEVSIVAINAEGKTLQEDKAVTEDPFNPLSSAVFTEDVISPSDILSVEDVDYKMGKPFDKSGEPLTEESFDIEEGVAPRQQLSDIATPLPRQQKSVREVVQQARDNNFKDAATKDFLTRKGVPTADIDKAIKALDDVYARVMKEIDGVITKSQKRGVEIDTQLKNALAYLQGTKLYEDTTDIHREKLMREVRAKFDKKEKRAPSAKRILGNIKDVKKVTLSEKEALKMQLRLVAKTAKTTARALVVASNELTKSLKEMVKGGVITANQMSSVLRRFSRVDLFNPASIDSFLDYMGKIFADAEYGAKIARIKKLLPRAKKNIKSKIGVADVLGDTLTKLFNVNPTLIPMEMLEDYQNLLEMMGAAKKVLPLADINDVTEVANKLLNAVYEEVSMAEDLAEVFANYANKVIKDGKVDYAATIEAMIADQTISLEEAAVMRKYKSRIVEPAKKEPKTEEELAEERAELMSAVEAAKVNVSRLVMDEERTLARQLAKLMRTEAIERLSNQQLETLLAVIDNINNGFVTHAAQRLAETMNASNRAESLLDSILKAVPLPLSTFVGKIKSGITKNNKFFESIKRNPLAYIDQVFGDFQTTRIYDAVFKPLAQAYDTFSLEMKKVDKRLTDAQEAVMKSFKNDPNKARMSSYKMMAYMLQREFEANPDNKQVNPAADFIRATIEHINKGQSFFKGKDAEMLQQILDDFGGEQIDSQKLYDSFNKAERNALAVMEDINKSMGSKAVFTGAVIRGRRVDALNQYAHHNVLSTSGQMDRSADVSIIEAYNQSMRASTKAKNLIERTGAATPLNFDVFSSVSRGSRFTLTDFYLTEPIRTSRKAISDTRKLLEERGDITKQENEIVNAVENALELTLDDLLTRTFSQSTMLENVIQYVKKTGYRLVLASGTRAMAEGASNLAFVSIYAPKDFAAGMANKKMVMGTVGIDVMSNLKSTQLSRMYPNEVLSGRMIDTSVLGEKAGDKGGRAYGDVRNKITQIYNGLLAPAKKGVELVADTLISAPDKAVIRPLWFGSFENAFVEITGKKPDFEKIAANDEAYMAANQEALNKATDTADQVTTLAGAADNPFKSMLRGKYPSKAKQTALLQFFNNFNSFMTRFLIYEYISARTAVNAMLGNGMISKRQGAALLGAVTTRMVVYTLAGTVLNQLLKQAFGLDEEEDEKDIMKQFGQSLASTATSLIVGRDFGNVVKGLLNYGVENLNEEFLDDLREGDYDPYRDSIAYTFIPPDKEYKSNTLADYIRNLMGPFGPFYKMAEFGVKTLSADEKKDPAARIRQQRELNERLPLELLGNLGLIPLYRDIRALLLADIYKGMGKDKKGSGTGMTKAEKAQMKEYFPELYKMQMQMEEDMKNPELEKFEKEMKLLEKQLEESLKQR